MAKKTSEDMKKARIKLQEEIKCKKVIDKLAAKIVNDFLLAADKLAPNEILESNLYAYFWDKIVEEIIIRTDSTDTWQKV